MVLDTNDAVNKVAAYAAGSRPHRKLSEQQLTEAWLAAFKKLADDPPGYGTRAVENDLASEFMVRGREPPYELVKDEYKRIMSARLALLEELIRDPVRRAQIEQILMADVATFKSDRDKSKN